MRDELLAGICRQYQIAVLYAFGSRAKEAEALLDAGWHILAKGFGIGVTEYREIAALLCGKG